MTNRENYLISKLNSQYIGDDGAIVGDAIYSMDAFFEGVHFKREWLSLAQIARKAMLVNISDVIAMNARPQYALITLSLPSDIDKSGIDDIISALYDTAKEFGCEIIGGDTVVGDKLNFSITIISHSNNPLTRKGLRSGDLLAYTGKLGGAGEDLKKLLKGEKIPDNSKFINPTLRADFIYSIREHLRVGIDISDGLYCDLNKLLDYNSIGFKQLIDIDDEVGLSGEEYEMLIGFDKKNLNAILRIAILQGVGITIFGEVAENENRFNCVDHHI